MVIDRQRPRLLAHQELTDELMAPVSVHIEKRGKKSNPPRGKSDRESARDGFFVSPNSGDL